MGWGASFFWGIILLFFVAAWMNDDSGALLLWVLVPFGLFILFIVSASISDQIRINRKKREDAERQARLEAEQEERRNAEREAHAPLIEAFKPVIEAQSSLNSRLLGWMRDETERTDKPEYRKYLEPRMKNFGPKGLSVCNSPILDLRQEEEWDIPVLRIPGYYLAPGDLLDKTQWERQVWFLLYKGHYTQHDESVSAACIAKLDLEAARLLIEYAIAGYLTDAELSAAVTALDLKTGSIKDLITANACSGQPVPWDVDRAIKKG